MATKSSKKLRNVNKRNKLSRFRTKSKSNLKKRQFTKKMRGGDDRHFTRCGLIKVDKIVDPDYLPNKLNCIMEHNIPKHKEGLLRKRYIYEFDKIIILFLMEEPVAFDKSDPNKMIKLIVDNYITKKLTVKPNDIEDFHAFIDKHYKTNLSDDAKTALKDNYDKNGEKNNVTLPVLRLTSSRKSTSQPNKKIYHRWFTNWPDKGVPDMDEFKIFIEDIFNDMKGNDEGGGDSDGDGTLIHCSAGVGRTGVVYVVLYLLFKEYKFGQCTELEESEKNKFETIIYNLVKDAKEHRHPATVQTVDQYIFICNYFGITNPIKRVEFEELTKDMIKSQILSSIPNECITKTYNRYSNILPSSRVKLPPLGQNNCSDYINASKMKPFIYRGKTFKIFAANCPIPNTFREFYRMLVQENINRIIMVTGFKENGTLKCHNYIKDFHRIDKNNQPIKNIEEGKDKYDYLLNTQLILDTSKLDTSEPTDINLIDPYVAPQTDDDIDL